MERRARPNIHFRAVAFVIGLVAFACTLIASCATNAAVYTFTLSSSDKTVSVPARGAALGDQKAPVTIEEYGDFQCPFCKEFADTVQPRIFEDYVASGKVQFIYHAFGNWVSRKAEGNTESLRTAEAAYYAAERNRFWQLHDRFFALQASPNSGVFSNATIIDAADQIALDGRKLGTSLESRAYAGRVQKDYDEGIARGVTSVPTFFVNGFMIVGAQSYEVFKSAIDDALRAAGESALPSR